jgi:hypothetical protein
VPDYRLPVLTIHGGVVVLDGEAQHRALIESDDCTIRWTPPSPSHGYEHVYVNIYNRGLAGSGVFVLSEDPDLKDVPQEESSKHVMFTVTKPNVNATTPSRFLLHDNLAGPATLHRSTRGGQTGESAWLEPTSLMVPGVTNLAPLPPIVLPTLDPDYTDGQDYWDLIEDGDVWAKGQVKTSASKPASFGKIAFVTYHSGGKTGFPVPIVNVSVLDDLCAEINKNHLKEKKPLTTFYSSVVEMSKDGSQMAPITVDYADVLEKLADKPTDGTPMSLLNLTSRRPSPAARLRCRFCSRPWW